MTKAVIPQPNAITVRADRTVSAKPPSSQVSAMEAAVIATMAMIAQFMGRDMNSVNHLEVRPVLAPRCAEAN